MAPMGDRVRELRKEKKLTLEKFGKEIGISAASISAIESGKNGASNSTIVAICRVYGVSETWLRTGEGEMFVPKDKEREIAEFLADVASDRENSVRRQLIRIMARLPEDTWETIEQILRDFANEQKEKPSD